MRPILLALAALLLAATALAADPQPRVYTVATSHLDTQWRWTIQETITDYLLRTLDDNFALLEQYPDYVFNFEGAFRYQLMQEYYPERFERLREYVRQGRWRVCGSWLDAVDVNMPSPESLYRHALYAQRWYDREFGKRSVDVFLPDCFGFGYALPSIMAHSGLTGFSTQKLTWGSAYGIPFDLGRWRGVDGSEVIAAVNPGAYVSDLEGDVSRDSTVIAAVERTVAAGGPPYAFKYYGTGDTGGAPSEGSVQWLEQSLAAGGPVEVISAGADQIYRELTPEQITSLPVWDNELVMTSHGAGCYTSQAAMKRWNRRCEVLGDAAERAAALAWWLGAVDYPHATLERAWTRFLWHGFHDDLTGTSIPEAYAFSWNDMLLSQQEFAQVLETSLEGVLSVMDTDFEGTPLLVFNPLGHQRTELVTVRGGLPSPFSSGADLAFRILDPQGREVPLIRWASDPERKLFPHDRWAFVATVPANGVAVYELRREGVFTPPANQGWDPATGILETRRYRLRLDAGGLQSLVDKQTGRELLAAPPRLQLLHDEPEKWAAWEIDYDDIMAEPYAEVPLGGIPETVVAGAEAARLTFRHEAAGSVFRQTLLVGGDRLDWELDIDWATKGTLLKAAFFTTARDTAVTYDLGLGAITRGLNRPLLYEVPAQRWADLTDASGDFGLTVMNDGRHGWDHPDAGTLRLSLLHTPAVNEHWRWVDDQKSQDLGRHRLTIGMMGHGADWRTAAVRAADGLNQPLLAFRSVGRHAGAWGRSLSLLQVGDGQGRDQAGVAVRALKKSEDGDRLVVRLQEVAGAGAEVVLTSPASTITACDEWRADEVPVAAGGDLDLKDGEVACRLSRYQPRTLALALAPPPPARRAEPVRQETLDLPWNLDGLSTAADPADGDLDGAGLSLPGELIPAVIRRDGVDYRTGPREPGAANLLRCAGQTLDLSATDRSHLRLLMCSLDGGRQAVFRDDLGFRNERWIPDGLAYFGQWDSRLQGDDIVHDAGDLVPAYTADQDIGWVVTHRRGADGRPLPYVFTHFYVVDLAIARPDGARSSTLTLPDDPALVVLAASLVDPAALLSPACELVDRPAYPSVVIAAERRAFVDTVTVEVWSPNRGTRIAVGRDGAAPVPHDGAPLTLTRTTALTVTASGPFPETTTRTATFTRLDPWPATAVATTSAGLATREYLGAWTALPDWSELVPARGSVSATVAIPESLPEEDIGAVMTGYLEVPVRGVYRFWLSSDDGSRLWIGDRQLIDHDGLHGASAVQGEAPLEAGLHPITVEFFQHLGGRGLKLEWSGPGFARQEVPAGALRH